MNEPFLVFPWSRPFLPALKEYVAARTGGAPGNALIITPNKRPWRYLGDLYAVAKKPGLLPKMLSVSDVISIWSAASSSVPYALAGTLDQIWYLREACEELSRTDQELANTFAAMPLDQFLPWGFRLAALFEEIMRQGTEPEDIAHVEGEVDNLAAALLGALGRIGALWRQKLAGQPMPLMTNGLECLLAAQNSSKIPAYLKPRPDRMVIIAGFSGLDGAEETLFRSLWEAGAVICLHGDPALATGAPVNPACADQADWIRRWQAAVEPYGAADGNWPECTFYMGYDDHSQLEQFVSDFEQDKAASSAIVLPGADLLMPVLHHLPAKDVNISMGYPLQRSRLYGFLDDLFRLQLHRQANGRYYWHDLIRLLNQPFLRMLSFGDGESRRTMARSLYRFENTIRNGTSYVDLDAVFANVSPALDEEEADFLRLMLDRVVSDLVSVATPGELADRLDTICKFLVAHGGNVWKGFPLDLEALARMQNRVLPELSSCRMNASVLPQQVLFGMLESLLAQERIPFEADPIVAAQIIGLLETRLLYFDNIYILGASDDKLPGVGGIDPLLPDALRRAAGLPDAGAKQRAVAYNLYRLLASAKKARFYWAESTQRSEVAGSGKGRSRYVDRLLWEEERRQGRRLVAGEAPFMAARAQARLHTKIPGQIDRSPALDRAMGDFLAGELSATALNLYLGCPARFIYQRLMRLNGPVEVNEGDDAGAAGKCIHATLAELLKPYRGRPVRLQQIGSDEIAAALGAQMARPEISSRLPVDSQLVLEMAGRTRIAAYLEQQDAEIKVQELEHERRTSLVLHGRKYDFFARLDRLDQRNGSTVIVDYKTGAIHAPKKEFWNDSAFFAGLDAYAETHPVFDETGDELLRELRSCLPDIQMPLYLLMDAEFAGRAPGDAVYVDLRDSGDEKSVLGDLDDAERQVALACCASAISFILCHMERTRTFAAEAGKCEYCEYARICQS